MPLYSIHYGPLVVHPCNPAIEGDRTLKTRIVRTSNKVLPELENWLEKQGLHVSRAVRNVQQTRLINPPPIGRLPKEFEC